MADNITNSRLPETDSKDLNPSETDFKSVRESKGLTLKDIFKSTRISVTTLAAIENSDFHLLPPPVFTKSFIKIYAKTLGVESTSTLARYEQYVKTQNTTYKDEEIRKPPARARVNYRRLVWVSLILVVAVFTIFSLSSYYKSEIDILQDKIIQPANDNKTDMKSTIPDQTEVAIKDQESSAQSTTDIQAQQPINEAERKPDTQQQQVIASQKIVSMQREVKEQYPITIKARELTWVRITIDHNPPYEILLKPGEKIEKSASQVMIDIGNAGGIDIEFQGKSLGNLGKQGEVVHLKLP
jgi:cytoskeleton protein RodZ